MTGWTRRDFLKASGAAGAGIFLGREGSTAMADIKSCVSLVETGDRPGRGTGFGGLIIWSYRSGGRR